MNNEFINPWRMPTKVKGTNLRAVRTWRDDQLHQVLAEVAKEETERLVRAKDAGQYEGPTNVSPETIIMNMVLFPSTFTKVVSGRMRDRHKQLKQEKRHEKKSIDGIKH